jgi:hypothetical protein
MKKLILYIVVFRAGERERVDEGGRWQLGIFRGKIQ